MLSNKFLNWIQTLKKNKIYTAPQLHLYGVKNYGIKNKERLFFDKSFILLVEYMLRYNKIKILSHDDPICLKFRCNFMGKYYNRYKSIPIKINNKLLIVQIQTISYTTFFAKNYLLNIPMCNLTNSSLTINPYIKTDTIEYSIAQILIKDLLDLSKIYNYILNSYSLKMCCAAYINKYKWVFRKSRLDALCGDIKELLKFDL